MNNLSGYETAERSREAVTVSYAYGKSEKKKKKSSPTELLLKPSDVNGPIHNSYSHIQCG